MPRRAPTASNSTPGTKAIHHSIHASACRRLAVASESPASGGNTPCAANASADNCTSTLPIRASQPASPSASRKRCPAHSSKTPGSTKANRLKANAHGIPIAPRKPSGCRRWAYSGRPIRAASKAPANNASAAAESLNGDVMPPC